MSLPTDLEDLKRRFLDAKNETNLDQRLSRKAAWFEAYGELLLEAAGAGLALSQVAAASEKVNQPQFLELLFEKISAVQMLVTDGQPYMQRELPRFGRAKE